jgi:hypothetical protein
MEYMNNCNCVQLKLQSSGLWRCDVSEGHAASIQEGSMALRNVGTLPQSLHGVITQKGATSILIATNT